MNTTFLETSTKRSASLTVLAWIFIVIGGFSSCLSLLQNLLLFFLSPQEDLLFTPNRAANSEEITTIFPVLSDNLHPFFLILLLLSFITFISAIGLLKRRPWARIVFILLMHFGIIWNIAGLIIQYLLVHTVLTSPTQHPALGFQSLVIMMEIASFALVLGISTLFALIIQKLSSPLIRDEFAFSGASR